MTIHPVAAPVFTPQPNRQRTNAWQTLLRSMLMALAAGLMIASCATNDRYSDMTPDNALRLAVYNGDVQAVQRFLDQGANPNAPNVMQYAAYQTYNSQSKVAVMKLLMARGGNVRVVDEKGATLLHWARGNEALIDFLLAQGLDINARDKEGKTPYYWAQNREDYIAFVTLRQRGANVNISAYSGKTPEQVNTERLNQSVAEAKQRDARRQAEELAARKQAEEAAKISGQQAPSQWELNAQAANAKLKDMQAADAARRARDTGAATQQQQENRKRCYSAGNAICN